MKAPGQAIVKHDAAELLDQYSLIYLRQYWPEVPDSAVGWADNTVLMLAYQEAALAVQRHFKGKPSRMLDVSTGPALAPLLAMCSCVAEVQLSDYNADNRRCLQHLPIEYWRNYVPMLTKLFDYPEKDVDGILRRLDWLRSQRPPVEVDLFRDVPFAASVDPKEFDLVSMQFVADSITNSEPEYLRALGRVTDMVRPEGALIMSAVVDSNIWQLGDYDQPSPNVSENTIVGFLKSQGLELLHLSRSIRHTGLSYSGGWIVLSAVKTE